MKRREILLGLSAAVTGGSAIFGTGAFTASQVTRDVDMDVVSDSQGLVGLIPNDDVAGVDEENGGQLSVDISDPGVNVNSLYQFGYFTEDYPKVTPDWFALETTDSPIGTDDFKSAFLIANQTNSSINLTFSINPGGSRSDAGGTRFVFEIHNASEKLSELRYPDQTVAPSVKLGSGRALGVSFVVNALDGDIGDSFSASMTIKAGVISQ